MSIDLLLSLLLALLILMFSKKGRRPVAVFPLLIALGLLGFWGLILGTLLALLFSHLLPPLSEWGAYGRKPALFRGAPLIYVLLYILVSILYILWGAAGPWGKMSPLLALALSLLPSYGVLHEARRRRNLLGHRPFIPVTLLPLKRKPPLGKKFRESGDLKVLLCLLPVLLIKTALPRIGLFPPSSSAAEILSSLPTEERFREHYQFQADFPYRPLGKDPEKSYSHYTLGDDGLINNMVETKDLEKQTIDDAAFPLRELSRLGGGSHP